MNDALTRTTETRDGAAFNPDEFAELQAAQERARMLRDEAISREQARLREVAAVLGITPEELLGLPARKRRSTKSPATGE